MDTKSYIKLFSFYFLSALYLFVVFGSIYGLFVDEITLFGFSFSGWSRILLCLSGLLVAALVSAYPMFLAVYRALKNNAK